MRSSSEKTGTSAQIAVTASTSTPADAPRKPKRIADQAMIGKIANSIG